jgi:hypothetical protein
MAGHKNWFPVTVTGTVVLQSGYDDELLAQGLVGWDADMDFLLRPTQPTGLTLASARDKGMQIGVEWDGYEVFFDQGDNPVSSWWNLFFRNRNNDTAKVLVNQHYPQYPTSRDDSVVIGLLGLDCRHYCHTELHPAYAMAIHTQANRTDDRWSVFAHFLHKAKS